VRRRQSTSQTRCGHSLHIPNRDTPHRPLWSVKLGAAALFGAMLASAIALTPSLCGQNEPRFTLHVTRVLRSGVVLTVEAESKTVSYELTCTETDKGDTCFMPQAGRDYQAKRASDHQFLYVYGITKSAAVFEINSQEERTRRVVP
jgi:hypothetical protein